MKKIWTVLLILLILLIAFFIYKRDYLEIDNQGNREEVNSSDNENINNNPTPISKNQFVSYNGKLRIENNTLVNQYGEKIQLRGISTHGIQWFNELVTRENISILKNEWNSNLLRIAMYTNESGYIENRKLKDKVQEIVEVAIENDMYVIIDWHILSDGNPMIYLNESLEFFNEMSLLYKDVPNVIFEICNEPNGNVTWDRDIKPYAEKITSVIRNNGADNIIIVGTSTWSQDVDQVVLNPLDDQNTMYALHFYAGTHTSWLRDRALSVLDKIPLFVSEWGVSDASGNGGVFIDEAKLWLEFMKAHNISWANWSLSNKNESSALLVSGATKIEDPYLSESGKFLKDILTNNIK